MINNLVLYKISTLYLKIFKFLQLKPINYIKIYNYKYYQLKS